MIEALQSRAAGVVFMALPMLCYAMQGGFVYLARGRVGMAIAMFGYCAANVGIIMDLFGV